MFTPKGKELQTKLLSEKMPTGDMLEIPDLFNKKSINPEDMILISTEITDVGMDGNSFDIDDGFVNIEIIYDEIIVDGQTLNIRNTQKATLNSNDMDGKLEFEEGKMFLEGESTYVEINEVVFLADENEIEFSILGTPLSYEITGVSKKSIDIENVIGLLKLEEWSPLSLKNDKIKMDYFDGSIKLEEGVLKLNGLVNKVKLNNLDLSIEE